MKREPGPERAPSTNRPQTEAASRNTMLPPRSRRGDAATPASEASSRVPATPETNPSEGGPDANDNGSPRQRPTVSLVICTLNEEKNLPHVLPHIPDEVDEVIIVDGHSTDDTVTVARDLLPDAQVVDQEGEGKGAALRTGFERASGDVVLQMDADGSMDPREIPRFVEALEHGADVVKGSRHVAGGGSADLTPVRVFGNGLFTRMSNACFGTRYTDLCYGFMGFTRSALERMGPRSNGFAIETELAIKARLAGLVIEEVPSFEGERLHGTTNLRTIKDGWSILRTIVGHYVRHKIADRGVGDGTGGARST